MTIKNKLYFIISSTACIFILVFFIILPSCRDIKKVSSEIRDEREYLEKLYLRGQHLKEVKKNFKDIEPHINDLEKIFIAPGEEVGFITSLENLAANKGIEQKLELENLLATKGQDQGNELMPYEILPLTLNLQGTFPQLITYLIGLELLDYYVIINSLTITNASVKSTTPIISAIETPDKLTIFLKAQSYRQ